MYYIKQKSIRGHIEILSMMRGFEFIASDFYFSINLMQDISRKDWLKIQNYKYRLD